MTVVASSLRFRISPIIRITLTLLYLALTVPLPFLAWQVQWNFLLAYSLQG